jgi:hypothetical protein
MTQLSLAAKCATDIHIVENRLPGSAVRSIYRFLTQIRNQLNYRAADRRFLVGVNETSLMIDGGKLQGGESVPNRNKPRRNCASRTCAPRR